MESACSSCIARAARRATQCPSRRHVLQLWQQRVRCAVSKWWRLFDRATAPVLLLVLEPAGEAEAVAVEGEAAATATADLAALLALPVARQVAQLRRLQLRSVRTATPSRRHSFTRSVLECLQPLQLLATEQSELLPLLRVLGRRGQQGSRWTAATAGTLLARSLADSPSAAHQWLSGQRRLSCRVACQPALDSCS